jgi:hypothetical protein
VVNAVGNTEVNAVAAGEAARLLTEAATELVVAEEQAAAPGLTGLWRARLLGRRGKPLACVSPIGGTVSRHMPASRRIPAPVREMGWPGPTKCHRSRPPTASDG